ncbi:AsmA family protein [Candidimonas humi]|uniref:AsmA family protein n=1 Tax=Candidimonas humi TaxID=683355 RepID=A0ABV8NV50_9BURK|nr:AsmA family protein [Candidimonas humi]MBV6303786.1 AsmA family protein [Candidimonas humi]
MRRYAKIGLWVVAAPLVALVLCVAVIWAFNWNLIRDPLDRRLSDLLHRPVAMQDLSVYWFWPQDRSGWRGLLPLPRIRVQGLTVGNPQWSPGDDDMLQAGDVSVVVDLWALPGHVARIDSLQIASAKASLQRAQDGTVNWSLTQTPSPESSSDWTVDLRRLQLQDVSVRVRDAANRLDLQASLDSLPQTTPEGYGLGWKLSGSYNRAHIEGQGSSGGILSLQQGSEPFPFDARVKIGETLIQAQGSVTRPQDLAALDVQFKLQGATMADLYPILGVVLPNTPTYSTSGHLVGTLQRGHETWTYSGFRGKVGASDIEGTLKYEIRKPRPLLSGELRSSLLRFKDLGPLVGVDTAARKAKRLQAVHNAEGEEVKPAAGVRQPAGKVLPVDPISTDSWATMDADVKFSGQKIVHSKELPLDHIQTHIVLKDRVLSLEPLDFGVAGGTLATVIHADGRSKPLKANMTLSARHLQLKRLFPGAQSMDASFGELHGDARLASAGNSIAALLGHANGQLSALISRGTISRLLLETAGLNVANILINKLFGDRQVVLNCMASDFSVRNGLMSTRVFRLDTTDAVVDVTGTINLATEVLDLDVKPKNKSARVFTLRTPLYVHGTFAHPDVGVYKGPLLLRAGAAVVLGVVATPFAALLPLLNPGTTEASDCQAMLAHPGRKPKPEAKPEKTAPARPAPPVVEY